MKNYLKSLLCISLLLFCWLPYISYLSYAQTPDNLHFERFTIEEGLSSDQVSDIVQDRLGYIWVSTQSGLNRYDGYDFTIYNNIPGDSTSLSNNFTNVVYEDRNGAIWAGTNFGLNRYNRIKDSFDRFYHDPNIVSSLPGDVIYEVFESSSGDLWIGTNNGLSLYDRENQMFINDWEVDGGRIGFQGIEITSIDEDAAGTLWIGTSNRGLISFNPNERALRYFDKDPIAGVSFPTNNIRKVHVDSSGHIWIAFLTNDLRTVFINSFVNEAGLGRLDPENGLFKLFKYDSETQTNIWDFISDITETQDSTIWVTSYFSGDLSGIHRFDRETEKFKKYSYDPYDPYSLTWAYCTAIFEDQFNNLWVGTSRGLNKADLSKWIMKTHNVRPDAPDLLLDNFYGIEEVQDNVFWLGLDGVGFIQWDRNTNESIHYGVENTYSKTGTEDITYGNLHLIKKDNGGNLWLGYSGNGIGRVDLDTKQSVKYMADTNADNALSGNYISGILVDESNTVWFSTTNGLNRYNEEDDTFTSWTTENSKLPSNSLSTIFQDSRGNLWLGTKKHTYDINSSGDYGLIKFDPVTEAATLYQNNRSDVNSISNNAINTIAEDSDGILWIGTNNGLNSLNVDEETFEQYHVKDGLPDPVIVGILFDDNQNIWLSTLKGLSRFDPVNKLFRNYGKDDGIQENRYNDYSYFKTDDGELIFGGVSGANYFYPSESYEVSKKPLINLTGVLVNNTPYELAKRMEETEVIDLAWNENSIGFEFTAINFRASDQTEYEYKLEGYDAEWVSSGSRRYVNYTNLSSGKYVFNVSAINEEGGKSVTPASLSIFINPPLWNTWWAYGVYLILLCGAIFGVDRVQRRRVIYQEKERAREKELKQAKKIEEAYRELEKSHKDLKSAQEQLVQKEKLASLGQLTAGIAHEIKNPLNFVNNFSDLSIELVDEVRDEINSVAVIHELKQQEIDNINDILSDIESNLKKIYEHGSRADSIVKSMLQHSSGASGDPEPTDLNELIREYTNLAFHGMRAAKDPLNVDIEFNLNDSIGDVPLVVEDFSRVIINICNNAFDAMREKAKSKSEKSEDYSPILRINTIKENEEIIIEIEDNGPGIPGEIQDKILQPFFTTKKGTEGTGLGLSITNDIIKAHGGSLDLRSSANRGTMFIIKLTE